MRLQHKIEIDLLDVFKTGNFDCVKIGKTKEWILNNFPAPDDYEAGNSFDLAGFWRYGNIEFYFDEDRLSQISTNYIDTLDGGEGLHIKKWIFAEPEKLTLQYVLQHLIKERIGFQVRYKIGTYLCHTTIGLLDAGVDLIFQPIEEEVEDVEKWYTVDQKLIDPNNHMLMRVEIVDQTRMIAFYQY